MALRKCAQGRLKQFYIHDINFKRFATVLYTSVMLCSMVALGHGLTVPQLCEKKFFGYKIQDPEDCHSFYVCLGNWGQYNLECGQGYRFNETLQKCVKGKCPPCPCLQSADENGVEMTGYIPAVPVFWLANTQNDGSQTVANSSGNAVKELLMQVNNGSWSMDLTIIAVNLNATTLKHLSNSLNFRIDHIIQDHGLVDYLGKMNSPENLKAAAAFTQEKKIMKDLLGRVAKIDELKMPSSLEHSAALTVSTTASATDFTTEGTPVTVSVIPTAPVVAETSHTPNDWTTQYSTNPTTLLSETTISGPSEQTTESTTATTLPSPTTETSLKLTTEFSAEFKTEFTTVLDTTTEITAVKKTEPESTTEPSNETTTLPGNTEVVTETSTLSPEASTMSATNPAASIEFPSKDSTTETPNMTQRITTPFAKSKNKSLRALQDETAALVANTKEPITVNTEESSAELPDEITTERTTLPASDTTAEIIIEITTFLPEGLGTEIPNTEESTTPTTDPTIGSTIESIVGLPGDSTTEAPNVAEKTTQATKIIDLPIEISDTTAAGTTKLPTEVPGTTQPITETPNAPTKTTIKTTTSESAELTTQPPNIAASTTQQRHTTVTPTGTPLGTSNVAATQTTNSPTDATESTTTNVTELPNKTTTNLPAGHTTAYRTTNANAPTTTPKATVLTTKISKFIEKAATTADETPIESTTTLTKKPTTRTQNEITTTYNQPATTATNPVTVSAAAKITTATTEYKTEIRKTPATRSGISNYANAGGTPTAITTTCKSTTSSTIRDTPTTTTCRTSTTTTTTTTTCVTTSTITTTCTTSSTTTATAAACYQQQMTAQANKNNNDRTEQIEAEMNLICSQHRETYFVKHPTHCNRYYTCHKQRAYPQICPGRFKFDEKLQICNYPDAVDCQIDGLEHKTRKTSPKKQPCSSSDLKPDDCRSLKSGTFIRDSTNCNKYYVCLNGSAVALYCPRGQYFDIERYVCNFKALVKNCSI